ncbi:MAG: lysophospholipid acyltransferase family protein [Treponema sp.]
MLAIFSIICCISLVLVYAVFNRIAYTFYRPWCKKINERISGRCARGVFAILSTYMNFRFVGDYSLVQDLPEQYLLISNHQSLLDIVLYMRYLGGKRLRFVAKKELGTGVPLVSVMLKSDHHCLVQRKGGPSQAMKAMDIFAENVTNNNWIPVLFPEGTRSKNGQLGTFYAAGFRRFLSKAPMPVAVAALDGGWKISSLNRIFTNLRGGAYRVKILKVYPAPATKEEQLKILEEGKTLISEQLKLWRAETAQ